MLNYSVQTRQISQNTRIVEARTIWILEMFAIRFSVLSLLRWIYNISRKKTCESFSFHDVYPSGYGKSIVKKNNLSLTPPTIEPRIDEN